MTPYKAVNWPATALLVAAAILLQDFLLQLLHVQPALALDAYRIAAWSVAAVAFTLIVLPHNRRAAYLMGFIVCAALMAWALYLQYGLGLDPCPLCVFQRIAVIATGAICLVAAFHGPGRRGAIFYGFLMAITAGIGAATAAWHVWIQGQPKGSVPACGMGLDYMLETLPLTDVISRVFKGSGECAQQGWLLLGLAIPAWTLVFFVAMVAGALALARRD
jgi:disulfide bond formation protein DsbB